jgi:GT2 family glycosyltransferase
MTSPGDFSMTGRVCLDGKFFRVGHERFRVRGVTYGTFGPNKAGDPFPEPAEAARDLALIRELGANVVRIYDLPPPWFRDAAAGHGLRLFVTLPWDSQSCFLDTRTSRRAARTAVTTAVRNLARHPAVFALALASEIPADIVRWCRADRIAAFLDELAGAAHDLDPGCLCTYANFPTTEFLQPRQLDFVTFNVFLHEPDRLDAYLLRLQGIAGDQPLVLGECGADALREGPDRQAAIVDASLTAAARAGLAGAVVFAFTDDWVRGGVRVEDWNLGLTTVDRVPRPAFEAVRRHFRAARAIPDPVPAPRVTVVVASYNAAPTLSDCLESLLRLDYPNYEILVIDDGSTDDTPRITAAYPQIRTLRHKVNLGLSTARNLGIRAATGEIIAFTDADCRADPDWLRYLVMGLTADRALAGIGGPNLLPPDDSPVAAAVMASPGGPAHVLLDDRHAEHLPGCNVAFWKWALDAVGGFDPVFRRAGDDVDICWRLRRRGWALGFAAPAFVWHHRRATLGDYFRQQAGYGEAEALLLAKHPEHFNALGGAQWQGRIGNPTQRDLPWQRSVIYRGVFATAPFQTLYTPSADGLLPLLTSPEFVVLIVLPAVVLAVAFGWLWPLAAAALLVPPTLAVAAASRVVTPPDRTRWWTRPLVAVLFLLQPLVRGTARHRARLNLHTEVPHDADSLEARSRVYAGGNVRERTYWSATWRDRRAWIERIVHTLEQQGWPCRADAGWSDFDLEIFGSRWSRLALVTVAEANRDRSQTLRCRLRPRWTLAAQMAFWGTAATLLALVGLLDVNWKGAWVPVVVLGSLAAFFRHQGRTLQCRLTVVLDEVAREWNLLAPDTPRAAPPPNRSGTKSAE